MAYLLGIDIGTSGTKTLICNDRGKVIATATAEHPISSPKPGWSEQDPQDWWHATCKSTKAVMKQAKIKAAEPSAQEEIRSLSPMLYSVQGENVYEVPRGYFDNLAAELKEKVKPAAKVVPMRRRTATFMKYAVAAAFTGVMALGVFKFTGNKNGKLDDVVLQGLEIAKTNTLEQEMNQLTDADIVKYLESNVRMLTWPR